MKTVKSVPKISSIVMLMIVFMLSGLTSKAQYVKAVKGDVVPFDTAVITNIYQYRAESEKMKSADILLTGYESEIFSLYAEIEKKDSLDHINRAALISKERLLSSKDKTIQSLNDQFNDMVKIAQDNRPGWWQKHKMWAGLIVGLAVGYYICNTIK